MYLPVIPTVRHADMSEGAGRFSPVTTKLVQDATQLGIDTALEPFQEKEAYALTIGEDDCGLARIRMARPHDRHCAPLLFPRCPQGDRRFDGKPVTERPSPARE